MHCPCSCWCAVVASGILPQRDSADCWGPCSPAEWSAVQLVGIESCAAPWRGHAKSGGLFVCHVVGFIARLVGGRWRAGVASGGGFGGGFSGGFGGTVAGAVLLAAVAWEGRWRRWGGLSGGGGTFSGAHREAGGSGSGVGFDMSLHPTGGRRILFPKSTLDAVERICHRSR